MQMGVRITVGLMFVVLALSNSLLQGAGAKERIAALKQSLQQSQAQLRRYEWIETTVVSLKGEEKSRKQNRCYYGADGKLQKVPIGSAPVPEQPRGRLRGRIVAKKTEELTDYMQQAVQLVHQYMPPDPARLQAANDANKVAFQVTEAGQRGMLTVSDYVQPGDALSLDIDLQTNTLLGIQIKSYLKKQDDAVNLNIGMSTLADGTSYAALTRLDAKAKGVRVSVENSGYRPLTP